MCVDVQKCLKTPAIILIKKLKIKRISNWIFFYALKNRIRSNLIQRSIKIAKYKLVK